MTVSFRYRDDLGLHKRQVTAQDVTVAERELGVALPHGFREFLLAHDGPTPSPGWFQVAGVSGVSWCGPIHNILSTGGPAVKRVGRRSCCLETLTLGSREVQRLPDHYVAIAQLATQPSILLLSTAAADYGTIYAWHVAEKHFHRDQVMRAAGSFQELLEMLTEPPSAVAAAFQDSVRRHEAGMDQRPAPQTYAGPEALAWLGRNRNPAALAANHFSTTTAAERFVKKLYAAGAMRVIIPETSIQEGDDMGPYADALVVLLPEDISARRAVCRLCTRESTEPEVIAADDPNPIFLWWD